jgi:hypothetical protein
VIYKPDGKCSKRTKMQMTKKLRMFVAKVFLKNSLGIDKIA